MAAGGRGIELTVSFNPAHPITSRRRKTLPQELADFAKSIDQHRTGTVCRDLFERMPELAYLWLDADDNKTPRWRIAQVYGLDFMSIAGLSSIIKEKEEKSAEYRPCDAYWLLIAVDWRNRAQEQEIRIDGGVKICSKVFERVVIYKPHFEHIVEVWP
jgi:hypothetical protein